MKKTLFFLSFFSLLVVQYGCESYHDQAGMEEQQEPDRETQISRPIPREHGGAAGNK